MIYFFYGENDYEIRQQVDLLSAKFLAKYGADALTKIECSEIDTQKLVGEIVNINMFAPNRLMVLTGLENNKSAWASVAENLSRIPDETSVIISVKSPDKRTKAFKDLQKTAKSQEFKFLKGRELNDWLMQRLNSEKLEFERDAVDELIRITSGDQWRMSTEVAKFAALNKVVTVELIRQFVEPDLENNAFSILELTLNNRREQATIDLKNLRTSEDPNKFFGLLASQIFALSATIHSQNPSQTASELKIHPFQLSKMTDLARRLGDKRQQQRKIRRILEILAKTDAKMKLSHPDDSWTLIELALARI